MIWKIVNSSFGVKLYRLFTVLNIIVIVIVFYFTYKLQFTIQDIIYYDLIMDNDCNDTELYHIGRRMISSIRWCIVLLILFIFSICLCCFSVCCKLQLCSCTECDCKECTCKKCTCKKCCRYVGDGVLVLIGCLLCCGWKCVYNIVVFFFFFF